MSQPPPQGPAVRLPFHRQAVLVTFCLLAVQAQPVFATTDDELVSSCRAVLAATEPARRVWLEQDLFAYEMRAAVGTSNTELRIYRENLADTCGRVAQNNDLRNARSQRQVTVDRRPAV